MHAVKVFMLIDFNVANFHPPWNSNIQPLDTKHQAAQNQLPHSRPERNIRDVNEVKALRRLEIERRCAAMDPPLTSNILSHMESFQAATQISQPMTEQAWQILRPRLLAQFPYAERKERERVHHDEVLVEEYRQRRQQEAQLKETKENLDREWEIYQNPVRHCLGALADEVIESRWAGGRSVTKDISPKFAADVLLQARQRFYSEVAQQNEASVTTDEPVNVDRPSGPPMRKLVLENMKWLFDTKVKPLTDHFQRELFLCNGCDGNYKFYGFEGVIQHYAAKHTTTLSMGNIVVHWRAEWPEHPPFNPNPSIAKTTFYKVPTPAIPHTQPVNEALGPAPQGCLSQKSETGSGTFSLLQDGSQYSVGTTATTYTGPHQNGHSASASGQPIPMQTTNNGLAGYPGAPNGYASNAASYNSNMVSYPGNVSQAYGSSYPRQQPYAASTPGQFTTSPTSAFHGLNGNQYGIGPPVSYLPNFQNSVTASQASAVPGLRSDLYQRQMDEMARHAKDVFIGIGGIKDLPGSVRIHVVIQLTVSRFKGTFPNEPSLSMFIDGLDHHAVMRPVRSVNGLGCKMCIQSGTGAKLFTLPHLVNHFRTVHMENPQKIGYTHGQELDWKIDMIDLPDASVISKLVDASGMTEFKLALIASVFQEHFPSPLPSLRGKQYTGPLPAFRRDMNMTQNGLPRPFMKHAIDGPGRLEDLSSNHSYGHSYSASRPLSQDTLSDPLEPPGEDEYDPHRPALINKSVQNVSASSQPHQPARPSTLQDDQRTSVQTERESSKPGSAIHVDVEQSFDDMDGFQSQFNDLCGRRPRKLTEHAIRRHSQGPDLVSHSDGQHVTQDDGRNMSLRRDKLYNYEPPINCSDEYCLIPGNADINSKQRSPSREVRSLSPRETAHAADDFLSGLVTQSDASHLHDHRHQDRAIDYGSKTEWQVGQQVHRLQKHVAEDGIYDHVWADRSSISPLVNHTSIYPKRAGLQDIDDGFKKGTTQRPESRTPYYREYRHPSSQAQKPLAEVRADHDSYVRPRLQSGGIIDKEETNGGVLTKPRSNGLLYERPHVSLYSHNSHSPHGSADLAPYRPRSPVEEDRNDPMSRAHPPFLHKQRGYPEEYSNYDFPEQARYEYIDNSRLREEQFQQRVEYISMPVDCNGPSRREPAARYYLSEPVESAEPHFIRYEPAYADERVEQVYERSGELYQASEKMARNNPTRVASSFAQAYKY